MEKQDSVPQGKGKFNLHGKKKWVIIGIVGIIALWFLIGTIGRAVGFNDAWGGRAYSRTGIGNVAVAVKDFESMGIVFAESSAATGGGYRLTYNALVKEAAKKGADAIINVNISSTGVFFKRTWSGSATAIKYLETVSGETTLIGEIGNTALMQRNGRFWGRNRF
jgi:hypothetical protein